MGGPFRGGVRRGSDFLGSGHSTCKGPETRTQEVAYVVVGDETGWWGWGGGEAGWGLVGLGEGFRFGISSLGRLRNTGTDLLFLLRGEPLGCANRLFLGCEGRRLRTALRLLFEGCGAVFQDKKAGWGW